VLLTLSLLGSPDVRIDGVPLSVDTRKALALLVYLVVEGGEHPRDRLVELLWPDTDPEKSRSSLRRTLSTLRTALDGRWVQADRSSVSIDRKGITVDLDEVIAAADDLHGHDDDATCPRCLPELRRAAERYRGDFLAGFTLRDAPEFESWVRIRAEQAGRRADRLFTRLASAQAAGGDYGAAIETTVRRIGIDSLHEEAHRTLMLLHAWSGDRSGAVDAYRRLVATLDTELGVSPLDETTELYEAILEEDLPRAPAPPRRPLSTAATPAPPALPLVGRDPALTAALAAFGISGGVVYVAGPIGIGVTRFLTEVAARMRADGATVLVGSGAPSGSSVPFGVVHDALLETLSDPMAIAATSGLPAAVLAEASRVFPGLSTGPPPSETGTPTRFFDAMARLIAALPRPVLIVDDGHHCDEASAEMLSFLAARARRFGISLVVACSPGEIPGEGPVAAMLEDVAHRGTVVTLEPLNPDDVAALVAAAGVRLDPAELARRTGGLPLFVTEAIRAAAAGRTEAVPDQIRKLFTERIAALRGAAAQVLDAVAVVGGSADSSLLAAVSGRSLDETDEALDALAGRAMVRESDDGTVTVAHEYLAVVVTGRHTAARRRLLHRRAAAALEARPGPAAYAIRIARHRLTAGEDRIAATWFRIAGDEAAAVFAHGEAIEHYEAALAAGHPDRAALHRAGAHSALLAGRYDRAIAGYEAALAEGGPDAVVEHRLGEVHRRLQRWDLAAAHYDRALQQGADPELQAIVAADRAFVESRSRGTAAASPLVDHALRLAGESGSGRALTRAENVAGLVAEGDDRVRHLRTALTHATEPAERMAVLNNLAAGVTDPGEAVMLAREALELAIELGDRHLMAVLHNTMADALHRAGKDEASMASLTEAVSLFTEITTGAGEPWTPEVWLLTEW
jgi:DNA-binding SARP family transcriptional activator/tetratricopeptide (TPR) repeat protein